MAVKLKTVVTINLTAKLFNLGAAKKPELFCRHVFEALLLRLPKLSRFFLFNNMPRAFFLYGFTISSNTNNKNNSS